MKTSQLWTIVAWQHKLYLTKRSVTLTEVNQKIESQSQLPLVLRNHWYIFILVYKATWTVVVSNFATVLPSWWLSISLCISLSCAIEKIKHNTTLLDSTSDYHHQFAGGRAVYKYYIILIALLSTILVNIASGLHSGKTLVPGILHHSPSSQPCNW